MTKVTRENRCRVARVLARAFYNDPLFHYCFPDEEKRERLLVYTYCFIASHALVKGSVFTTSDTMEGVALWFPSSSMKMSIVDHIRLGAVHMFVRQGIQAIKKQINASNQMKSIHSRIISNEHMYLSTIGIDVPFQGKGFASKLLRPMLETLDDRGLPCYLETYNLKNVSLYESFGFKVMLISPLPGSDIFHYAMLRPARR